MEVDCSFHLCVQLGIRYGAEEVDWINVHVVEHEVNS